MIYCVSHFSCKMPNTRWSQLVKCEDFLHSFVMYDSKLNLYVLDHFNFKMLPGALFTSFKTKTSSKWRQSKNLWPQIIKTEILFMVWVPVLPWWCVVVQAGRQDVSVIEQEVWVLQHHRLFMRWMQELNIYMCAKALTLVLCLRCEMQGQDLQCK